MNKASPVSLAFWFLLLSFGFASPFIFSREFSRAPRSARAADLGDAPRIVLTDSRGAEFDSQKLSGKLLVVNFFFSSCGGICPAMNGRIAALYRLYQRNPNIEFVSITIDPETDTPEVLRSYAERFQADPARWHFLTGPKDSIRSILDGGFHLVTSDDPNMHTTRVVLVDGSGRIRGYYQGTDEGLVSAVSQDISAILPAVK